MTKKTTNRRDFIKKGLISTAGTIVMPGIIASCAQSGSKEAKTNGTPNGKINIAQIGCGRIARGHDMYHTIRNDVVRMVACADVDIKRALDMKTLIGQTYQELKGKKDYVDVKAVQDYKELLDDPSIDAVLISTPDHWHAQIAMEAALKGKHVYLQKPASLTIEEGRQMSEVVTKAGIKLQIGSQQRSIEPWPQFKQACELVRNGYLGEIQEVYVGLPGDPGGDEEPEMPIPENLDYDMWLGSTPDVYYTEKRVHPHFVDGDPKQTYSRPGWLRCEQFGSGMITGWGAHHIDTAHWGMGTEHTGPIEVEAEAVFPESGLWNVHGPFRAQAKYANGVTMHLGGENPNGVKFVGTEGWIFVSRGAQKVTASDPGSPDKELKALEASDPKLLDIKLKDSDVKLIESQQQHHNWIQAIQGKEELAAPVEVGHRSCSACLVNHIAMKVDGPLRWDPEKEMFIDNEVANAMTARPQRKPYGTNYVNV